MATHRARTVIYGAGAAGLAAQACLAREGTHVVVAFADNDRRKIDTSIGTLRVVGPNALDGSWFDDAVIASHEWREITTMLMRQGIQRTRLFVYHPGEDRVSALPQISTAVPNVLVLTDDCVSPGHGIGAVLLRHLAKYPQHRLSNVYLRRKGDPFWPASYAMAVDAEGEASGKSARAIATELRTNGQTPDLIYANVSSESGFEALHVLIEAFGGSIPVIQHFHDVLPVEVKAFGRVLRALAPHVTEFWAITDALGRHISGLSGRPVDTVNTFKCEIAAVHKREHREFSDAFKVVMLGNSHMPRVLHHVRNVWRRLREVMPGLAPIQWYAYPTSALYVRDAGVVVEPEIEYYGYLNDRVLHEHLCAADLALVPFNIADEPEYPYAAHSVPSRITEFLNAGLPMVAAAGRGTETFRFLTEGGLGVCATIADEAAFAGTLLALMRDTERRRALGQQGRAYAEAQCDVGKHQEMLTTAFARVSAWRQASPAA